MEKRVGVEALLGCGSGGSVCSGCMKLGVKERVLNATVCISRQGVYACVCVCVCGCVDVCVGGVLADLFQDRKLGRRDEAGWW